MLNRWSKTSGYYKSQSLSRRWFSRALYGGLYFPGVGVNRMGIHGLSKVIGDHAPSGSKENEIKNYFGKWEFDWWPFVASRLELRWNERI